METYSPGEVCEKLKIQPSTLRKYSSLLEKEQIVFARNNKNSRIYKANELVAIEQVIAATHSGKKSLENAVVEAAEQLKRDSSIATESTDTVAPPERYGDDIAVAMLNEIKSLKRQLHEQEERQKERDSMFVEVLEKMQQQINRMENQQKQLSEPPPEEEKLNAVESQPQQEKPEEKRGLWARIWNKQK